jgi:hypothetical protein
MAGTSIAKVFDYLVQGLPAPAAVVAPNVVVADDVPGYTSEDLIVIGRAGSDESDSGQTTLQYGALGAQRIDEAYTVPGFVYAERQGPGAHDARVAATALIDVVVSFVHADPLLGGNVNRPCQLTQMTITQYGDPGDTGAQTWCSISFGIAVQNTYIP